VVTGLWTLATLLRVERVWVTVVDWRGVFAGHWIWISLLLPPTMFAVVLRAIYQLGKAPRK